MISDWLYLWVFVFNFLIWLLVLLFVFLKHDPPIYHPVYVVLIYHFFGYIIRPLNIYQIGYSPLWDRIGIVPYFDELMVGLVVINAAIVSVVLGFSHANTTKLILPKKIRFETSDNSRLILLVMFFLFLGIYGTIQAFIGGGTEQVLAYQTEFDARGAMRLVDTSGYVTALAEFPPVLLVFLFLFKRLRAFTILLVGGYVGVRLYIGSQRLSFIVVLVGIYIIYMIENNLKYPKLIHILLALFFLTIFDFVGNDRLALRKILDGQFSISQSIEDYKANRGGQALTSDISEFDASTAAVAAIYSNDAYTLGTQYLRLIIWPIPRQLWPDKPVFTSIVDLNDYGNFLYLTIGLYADLYWAFGLIWVVFCCYFIGYLSSRLYNIFCTTIKPIPVVFFIVLLMYFKTILRDGGVTVFYFWIFSMLPMFVIIKFSKLRVIRDDKS